MLKGNKLPLSACESNTHTKKNKKINKKKLKDEHLQSGCTFEEEFKVRRNSMV